MEITFHRIACDTFERGLSAEYFGRPIGFRIKLSQHAEHGAAHGGRNHAAHALLVHVPTVAPVAGEVFIAAIAGERDGDVFARQFAHAVRGQGGTIGIRFIVERGEFVDEIEIIRGNLFHPVIGMVARGDLRGVFGFVVGRIAERNRTGVHRLGG